MDVWTSLEIKKTSMFTKSDLLMVSEVEENEKSLLELSLFLDQIGWKFQKVLKKRSHSMRQSLARLIGERTHNTPTRERIS